MSEAVAIVGMAGRFPGASCPRWLWRVVRESQRTTRRLTPEEAEADGVGGSWTTRDDYVPVAGVLDDVDRFDSAFFGIGASEADLLDPQQRLLLECCSEALEDAGCAPELFGGRIGVFAGVGASSYRLLDGRTSPLNLGTADEALRLITNDKDFAATRAAYRLDLRGPAVSVQTACSTSLVAVHQAALSLSRGDSDAVLAGGASVRVPHRVGYLYQQGGILSPDGCCRPFSAEAAGTVPSSGAGIVLLKRLSDAVENRDHVYAVLLGSAINNDGSPKLSYAAPSVEGQVAVIETALARAGVDPSTIDYLETHGTGTLLGDSMELAALNRSFAARRNEDRTGGCALGSVKANLGHLDVAAGVTGLIKAALSVHHGTVPPAPNSRPESPDLAETARFRLPESAEPWPDREHPRRAGVSSFGIGGTNAHVVLEQAPPVRPPEPPRPHQLLLLSARTETALAQAAGDTSETLREVPLESAAQSLLTGRNARAYRCSVVADGPDEAATAMREARAERIPERRPGLAFLFPGPGAQWPGMLREVYDHEPVFRDALDHCAERLAPRTGHDIRELLCFSSSRDSRASRTLRRTDVAMPAVFAVEYALTRLLDFWNLRPDALLGYSLGECVAACVSGVLGLDDALELVAHRGALLASLPAGGMLNVGLPREELRPLLHGNLAVAVDVGPDICLASGPLSELAELEARLTARGVTCRRVPVDYAGHSAELDPVVGPFRDVVAGLELGPPRLPYLANATGDWITAEQAASPTYWARQLRETVRLNEDFTALADAECGQLLEVGPGRALTSWARRHPDIGRGVDVLPTLGGEASVYRGLLASVGRMWERGQAFDRGAFEFGHAQRRVPLPAHPFERGRHWITSPEEPVGEGGGPVRPSAAERSEPEGVARGHTTTWERVLGVAPVGPDDDFFELGGDSLVAVQLAAAVNEDHRSDIAPQDLLRAPTPRKLAALLGEDGFERTGDSRSSLTALGGSPGASSAAAPPLYLVHPVGGGALVYRDLAESLDGTCEVLGFTARGFQDRLDPRRSVAEMARAYVAELLSHRPEGDFWLGGSSFGGVVAFEMTRLLAERHRAPLLTALIDSPWPPQVSEAELDAETNAARLSDAPPDVRESLVRLRGAHVTALRDHVPAALSGDPPFLYVRASESDYSSENHPESAWREVVPGMLTETSPGGHESMLRHPNASALAAVLTSHLPGGGSGSAS
ncbi:type I polyketide synthase [Actinopolyspora erythraea]|uniref:Type I polyketide synthase n=1 Tax=Actinopolyspora erythraea TaxID=414996 RepID=A0A223RX37_9ACTN|nr:type I polyketide synthase [Actinopolyspora erythraea]ASU80418.1 type I polyketide synthase [Actinopolyspora erythraea]